MKRSNDSRKSVDETPIEIAESDKDLDVPIYSRARLLGDRSDPLRVYPYPRPVNDEAEVF